MSVYDCPTPTTPAKPAVGEPPGCCAATFLWPEAYSDDGNIWSGGDIGAYSMIRIGSVLYAVQAGTGVPPGVQIRQTTDGKNWSNAAGKYFYSPVASAANVFSNATNGSIWAMIYSTGSASGVMGSSTFGAGAAWTLKETTPSGVGVKVSPNDIAFIGNKLVCVGSTFGPPLYGNIIWNDDLTGAGTWKRVSADGSWIGGAPFANYPVSSAFTSVAVIGGTLYAIGVGNSGSGSVPMLYSSPDGENWTDISAGIGTSAIPAGRYSVSPLGKVGIPADNAGTAGVLIATGSGTSYTFKSTGGVTANRWWYSDDISTWAGPGPRYSTDDFATLHVAATPPVPATNSTTVRTLTGNPSQ